MNENWIIANSNGEYLYKLGIFGIPKYVPRDAPEYALHFREKEDDERYIKRKQLNQFHQVVKIIL